ncbi:hypothetical protein [Mumia sp.]|uniref:hypothetical protein n=1 Tax=Mumia sp. TaxID=1965300 RepID=UPI002629DF5E|nr:hypothetical protein [Mumia sp.]MDD9348012.1 hypothetical protein [Mumia sp.]
MPVSTLLAGVALFVVIVALERWRRHGLLRDRGRAGQRDRERRSATHREWLATGLVLETDPDTADAIVDRVVTATMSKPVGPRRWALLTGFEEHAASAGWVRTASGEIALAALTAPDRDGAPDGSAWLDFRDRVAKAARKAGVTTHETETGALTSTTDSRRGTVWTSPAAPA